MPKKFTNCEVSIDEDETSESAYSPRVKHMVILMDNGCIYVKATENSNGKIISPDSYGEIRHWDNVTHITSSGFMSKMRDLPENPV